MSSLRDGELESASEMAEALRAGEVRSSELVERAVRRAEAWQPAINAFSQLWADEADQVARRIDGASPAARAPLAGIPVAVKDLFDVAGHETTGCCAAYRGVVAERDATVIASIRRDGLVMIGKTNQHELAAGGTNLVSACGRTGNPWDPRRMTGGSSGGSAAAVAAGIVPWALGSDTGGSIRIPSSMCGTFGLKPTTGSLPLDGVMPLAPSLDCPGPIAGTAADLQALFEAMGGPAGREPGDATGSGELPRGLRVGVPGGFFADLVHEETLGAVEELAEVLADHGARVEGVDGGGLEGVRRVWMGICGPEFVEAHRAIADRLDQVDPSVVAWMRHGEGLSEDQRAGFRQRREEVRVWFLDRLERFDVLLIPTTPYPAPAADQPEVDLGPAGTVRVSDVGPGWLSCSVNLAGLPAVNLPVARSSDGVPIGVSVVGGSNADGLLLRLAVAWERLAPAGRPARPELPR